MTFFLMLSTTVLADPFDDGIEPPPTAPIDTATIYLAVVGIVFAAYYFYTSNLKSQKNETKIM
jgi:mannose/fructose/N-acetylgalactosamine-specific phosphotransferase system component IIC